MINLYTPESNTLKTLNKASKKLKIDKDNISFAAYEKFLFSFMFAIAIKDKKVYLFATDEGGKKSNVYSTYDIKEVKDVGVDNKTDFNLHLTGGRFINLTSMVGLTPKSKKIIKAFNEYITKAR